MKILESPIYINWNYTLNCNFSCKHCYSRGLEKNELSTNDYRKIAEKIINSKIFQVNLGGGEPLLREDIFEITKILSTAGIKVNLTTNGFLFNKSIAKKLKESGLKTLFVSLDDIREEEHDDFRNKKNSYKKALNCINIAKKYGIEVILSTVVTKKNLSILEDIVSFAKKKEISGIDFKKIRLQGNAINIQKDYSLNNIELKTLYTKIENFKQNSDMKIFFIYSENGIKNIDAGCPCGRISLSLLPNGDLSPCVYNQYIIGNILNDNLCFIWQNSPALINLRTNFKCVADLKKNNSGNNLLINKNGN